MATALTRARRHEGGHLSGLAKIGSRHSPSLALPLKRLESERALLHHRQSLGGRIRQNVLVRLGTPEV